MSIQGFNQNLFYDVCSNLHDRDNLSDRDVKSVGITSQAMLKMAQKILHMRDERLKEILSFYTPTRFFNIQSLEQADEFLVGEAHRDPECLENQRNLINFLTIRGNVFLSVEEDDVDIANDEKEKDRRWGENQLCCKDNIFLSGWDDKKRALFGEDFDSLKENQKRIGEIFRHKFQLLDQFKKIEKECTENEGQEILQLLEFYDSGQTQDLKTYLMKVPTPTLLKFDALMKLKASNYKLDQEHRDLKHLIRKATIRVEFLLDKEYVYSTFDNDPKLISIYRGQYARSPEEVMETLAQGFPQRTTSMTRLLRKVREKRLEHLFANLKGVHIAGAQHYEQQPENLDDNRFNLDSLYDELKHHRAVILMPTKAMAEHRKFAAEFQEYLQNVQMQKNQNTPQKND